MTTKLIPAEYREYACGVLDDVTAVAWADGETRNERMHVIRLVAGSVELSQLEQLAERTAALIADGQHARSALICAKTWLEA